MTSDWIIRLTFFSAVTLSLYAGLDIFLCQDGTGRQMRRHKQNCPAFTFIIISGKVQIPFYLYRNGCDGITENARG